MAKKNVDFPDHVLEELRKMTEETGIPGNHLILMATLGLISKYRELGIKIFAGLTSGSNDLKGGKRRL